MAAPSSSTSWFNQTFASAGRDYSEELMAVTAEVPDCAICLEKVSDPVALKCGHIFDRHCIKNCLDHGLDKCPYDRKDVKETDFVERPDIYESTKCRIKVAIFSASESSLIEIESSIFSTAEKVKEKVIAKYLKDSGKDKVPVIRNMTIRRSYKFYPEKTLADYQVFPGIETLVWVFLA